METTSLSGKFWRKRKSLCSTEPHAILIFNHNPLVSQSQLTGRKTTSLYVINTFLQCTYILPLVGLFNLYHSVNSISEMEEVKQVSGKKINFADCIKWPFVYLILFFKIFLWIILRTRTQNFKKVTQNISKSCQSKNKNITSLLLYESFSDP